MIFQALSRQLKRLSDALDAAPPWKQTFMAFAFLGSLGAVGGFLWHQTFGVVLQIVIILVVAAALFHGWRWGLTGFVVVAGTVWATNADYPASVAFATVGAAILAGMFTMPAPPSRSGSTPRVNERASNTSGKPTDERDRRRPG